MGLIKAGMGAIGGTCLFYTCFMKFCLALNSYNYR